MRITDSDVDGRDGAVLSSLGSIQVGRFCVQRGWLTGIETCLGPVDLCSIPARAFGFKRAVTLSKLCTYACAPTNQAIHPARVGKFLPTICQG